MCFESVDEADPASQTMLAEIVAAPGRLRLPVVMTLAADAVSDADLTDAVRRGLGDDAMVELAPVAHGGTAAGRSAGADCPWERLPSEVLRTLRAGAVIGAQFETGLLARLLERPPGAVLETLQAAVDAGAPLSDHGDGRLTLAPAAAAALADGLLPSLRRHWHRRLGELLSHPDDTPAPALSVEPPPPTTPAEAATLTPDPAKPARYTAHMMSAPSLSPLTDPLRAATHLRSAGQTDAALTQLLNAVQRLAGRGDFLRAYQTAEQALRKLEKLPLSPPRSELRARLLLAQSRLQWQGYGAGAGFTLERALASLREAETALPSSAPIELLAELATNAAGICYDLGYDLGDRPALDQALAALAELKRQVDATERPLLAAQLYRYDAALRMRLNDPERAAALLARARTGLEALSQGGDPRPEVALVLGETYHLLARLALHAGPDAAATEALTYAAAAERVFRRLDRTAELGRVWETAARLEMRDGATAAAAERLRACLSLQQQSGDVIGLARSSAALAELCAGSGQWRQALALLGDSITLNGEKGSPMGLAFNRRALTMLNTAIGRQPAAAAELRAALGELDDRLRRAETRFGRLELQRPDS